jgi:adenylate cyclase
LAFLCTLIALRIWDPTPVATLRLQAFDLYQRVAPRESSALPALIVDIDNESLSEVGQWPWPRSVLTQMVAQLFRAGAVVVGFDVIFAEPDRMSPQILAHELPGLDDAVRDALRKLPNNDAVFAGMMRRARVVLAQAPVALEIGNLDKSKPVKSAVAEVGGNPRPFLFTYSGMVRNLPALEAAAKGLGSITLSPEADGVARRVPLVVNAGGHIVPTLTVEMLRVATGQRAFAVKSNKAGIDSIVVAGVSIPTDRFGRKWVHFAAPDPMRYVSAKDVLAGKVGPNRIKGKLVVVGTSATSLGDIKATPVASALPGVEVHVQLLETILAKSDLVRPNYAIGAELVLLAFTGLLIIVFAPLAGAIWTLFIGGFVAGALGVGSWYLYATKGHLIDVAFASVAGLAIYGVITYTKYIREESNRKSIRRAFSQYLAPAVIDRLAADPGQLRLGGEIRDMTVLFSDVQGFTAISERLSAEALTTLMNRVLTRMTAPILAQQGTIDKYIGDSVMAFWNAPLADPQHPAHACHAALFMLRDIQTLNAELGQESEAAGEAPTAIAIRIGLNSGECNVGNLGSEQHFNYSVLGDTVNLASRLEGQAKFYGCPIVVGEATALGAPDFAFLELDLIRVVGKTQPARVFALLGDSDIKEDASFVRLSRAHDDLIGAYRGADWARASKALARCRELAGDLPLGKLYDIYEERLASHPMIQDVAEWDGVYEAVQK